MNTIQPTEVAKWKQEDRDFVVLDVLSPESFEMERIPGAVNASVYAMSFVDDVAKLVDDPAKPVVVYATDDANRAAADAWRKLDLAGYEAVYVLAGGIRGWPAAEVEGAGYAGDPAEAPERPATWKT